jgi:hypothetical protein
MVKKDAKIFHWFEVLKMLDPNLLGMKVDQGTLPETDWPCFPIIPDGMLSRRKTRHYGYFFLSQ